MKHNFLLVENHKKNLTDEMLNFFKAFMWATGCHLNPTMRGAKGGNVRIFYGGCLKCMHVVCTNGCTYQCFNGGAHWPDP